MEPFFRPLAALEKSKNPVDPSHPVGDIMALDVVSRSRCFDVHSSSTSTNRRKQEL